MQLGQDEKHKDGMAGCRGELTEGGVEKKAMLDEIVTLGLRSAMDKYSRYQREVSTEHLFQSLASYICPKKTKVLCKNTPNG